MNSIKNNINFLILVCIFIVFAFSSILRINGTTNTINTNFVTPKKYVALTFDDGPEKYTTEELLKELKKEM